MRTAMAVLQLLLLLLHLVVGSTAVLVEPVEPHMEPVAQPAPAPPRPSVLFLLADDLGYAGVGYHEPFVQTPHIDRLAREGVRLEGYYVQPICSPTRSSLMTGRYTYRIGTQAEIVETYVPFGVPLRERFLPELFQASGYRTAMFGKVKRPLFPPPPPACTVVLLPVGSPRSPVPAARPSVPAVPRPRCTSCLLPPTGQSPVTR